MREPPSKNQILKACMWAKEKYEREGEIEVDLPDGPKKITEHASACENWKDEGGFYVKAWIWVPHDSL